MYIVKLKLLFLHHLGIPYSSYSGFMEWSKKFNAVTLEWKDLKHTYDLIPGLVEKLGNIFKSIITVQI